MMIELLLLLFALLLSLVFVGAWIAALLHPLAVADWDEVEDSMLNRSQAQHTHTHIHWLEVGLASGYGVDDL